MVGEMGIGETGLGQMGVGNCFRICVGRKTGQKKRLIAIPNTSRGGVNIPDIKTYIKALKLT